MSEAKKVGYMFTVNYAVGTDKNIQVVGNFPEGADPECMGTELDKVFKAMDRQRLLRLQLPTAQEALSDQKERLEEEKKALAVLAAKPKLVGVAETYHKQHLETIRRLEEVIPKGEAFVAELEKKAA